MILYEYFELNKFDDVLQCLYNNYTEIDSVSYKNAWEELRTTEILPSKIESIFIENADFEGSPFINVYGLVEDEYGLEKTGLEYLPWGEWLGLEVETDLNLTQVEVLCHILYEMTFNGFSMTDIKRSIIELKRIVDDIDTSEEFCIIKKKDIEPIIFKSYQRADITTAKASKILEISKSNFVNIYEDWSGDNEI